MLGTIALEPNRWSSRTPSIDTPRWIERAVAHGFSGVELWGPHYDKADPATRESIDGLRSSVAVYNTYLVPETGSDAAWKACAATCRRLQVRALKYNFGADESRSAEYVEVLNRVRQYFPPSVGFLCECHPGTIAEQPEQALSLLSRPGLEDIQIICHPFLIGAAKLKRWLDAFGNRVAHMHVQLRDNERAIVRLDDASPYLRSQTETLVRNGFHGTWTIEFVHGTGTANDEPEHLFAQACSDRDVLVALLNSTGTEA